MNKEEVKCYLGRIGYAENIDIDIETLRRLHKFHVESLSFENLNIFLKKTISLSKEENINQILKRKRSGYCYQLNGLFYELLVALGFQVRFVAARPLFGYSDLLRPATHMALVVSINDKQYLVDTAFGGIGLREPMALEVAECVQGPENFRLIKNPNQMLGDFILQTKFVDDVSYLDLFSVSTQSVPLIDFMLANFFNSNSPDSRFTKQIVVAGVSAEGRKSLSHNEYKVRTKDGVKVHSLKTFKEFNLILDSEFGIALNENEILALENSPFWNPASNDLS